MNRLLVGLVLAASCCYSQTSYIKDWLVLGTFPNPDPATRLSQDYLGGEASHVPVGGEMAQGRQWVVYHSPIDYLNFRNSALHFSPIENAVSYAAFFVHSPSRQPVRLLAGSDDALAVWCNGTRIHFLEVHRGIQLDSDTMQAELQEGWNRFVFKVANADGGFALSARFEGGSGLTITPVNTFTAPHDMTPARVILDSTQTTARFVLTRDDRPELHIDLQVRNTGMSDAEDVAFESSSEVAGVSVPVLHGGEVKTVSFVIPFRDALAMGEEGAGSTLTMEYGDNKVTQELPGGVDLLRGLFSPWKLEGGGPSDETGPGILFARTILVPPELAGLEVQCAVNIGEAWGSVLVNGDTLLGSFSGDSGDLLLTRKAVAHDTLALLVTALQVGAAAQASPVTASLRPRNEPIELFIDDLHAAREIYGVNPGDQSKTLRALFGLLRAGQADRSGELLAEPLRMLSSLVPDEKRGTLHFVGNAHIDMAWLWRYTETIDVTRATLRAAVDNLRTNPGFTFSHGQAQSYLWVEEHDPALFRQIQSFVKEGRWEIVGGSWVEPDANMPSGESLVRQYLYGKRYFKNKFGVEVRHGWNPDTFGHPASLPKILAGCGIDTYTFFRPEQTEKMYRWESPGGGQVVAHHPSNWYGTWSPLSDTLWRSAARSNKVLGVNDALQFYGVGDHGGGPTRRDIATIEHLSRLTMYPKVKFSTFDDYYRKAVPASAPMPSATGEQNPVFEGCYTSQAMVKANNRKAEAMLPSAELFSAIAAQYGYAYPSGALENAWRLVLFNQFHDVLCGSGIHAVYDDARVMYDSAFALAGKALQGALHRIAGNVDTRHAQRVLRPVLLFNPLSWKRSDPVVLTLPVEGRKSVPRVVDGRGRGVDAQVIEVVHDSVRFAFAPDSIPSVGYRTFWVRLDEPSRARGSTGALKQDDELKLENRFFRVEIDPNSGAVTRIYDRVQARDVLAPGAQANQLTIQEDDAGMSAWVIGLKGEPRPINAPSSVRVVEDGPVRKTVRVEHKFEQSSFVQDITLYASTPRIDFRLSADWHHRKRMMKVVFPLSVSGGKATFEIPYGSIERTADGREGVMQKWVDVSTTEYGVSLVNDAKYGVDVNGATLRLTALRGPTDPDPGADEGHHEFSYALYPHAGDWREGLAVRHGYEFNTPTVPLWDDQHRGNLPSSHAFIRIEDPGIVLTAMKKCEDDDRVLLRCYEAHGRGREVSFRSWLPVQDATQTDLMEWKEGPTAPTVEEGKGMVLGFGANEVRSWKISFAPQPR